MHRSIIGRGVTDKVAVGATIVDVVVCRQYDTSIRGWVFVVLTSVRYELLIRTT
jgi:hypothetical protein